MKRKPAPAATACPCGGQPAGAPYAACCEPLLAGIRPAPDAAALMRSRYCAYTLADYAYLRRTWDPATCPPDLEDTPADVRPRWLGLSVERHTVLDDDQAEVEFVARYKLGGRAYRLHESSRFVRRDGLWLYVAGVIHE
jgi:SEC-C motif domain protein